MASRMTFFRTDTTVVYGKSVEDARPVSSLVCLMEPELSSGNSVLFEFIGKDKILTDCYISTDPSRLSKLDRQDEVKRLSKAESAGLIIVDMRLFRRYLAELLLAGDEWQWPEAVFDASDKAQAEQDARRAERAKWEKENAQKKEAERKRADDAFYAELTQQGLEGQGLDNLLAGLPDVPGTK
jgi:hypothetical protein